MQLKKSLQWLDGFKNHQNNERHTCGPRISAHAFSTRWRVRFLFEKWFYLLEKDLESPLIFVLFSNGKQNKKENLKCDYLFGKGDLWKTKYELGGQVTYQEGTIKTVAPL